MLSKSAFAEVQMDQERRDWLAAEPCLGNEGREASSEGVGGGEKVSKLILGFVGL